MPATDDEIREKYLERAIRELNTLTRELLGWSPTRAGLLDDLEHGSALAGL